MARTPMSMQNVKQILLQRLTGASLKGISRSTGLSLRTVKKYVRLGEESDAPLADLVLLDDTDLSARLLGPPRPSGGERYEELACLFEEMERELQKIGVTREQLWHQYKQDHPDGYNYSRFCYYLRLWREGKDSVMHLEHLPGEKVFVDFAGKKLRVVIGDHGHESELEVFVGILGGSGYTYAEALESQKLPELLEAGNNMLEFFGGAPKVIVPDNMKTAVVQSSRYEPSLNTAFAEFANHYQMAVIPTRTYKPRDKALVENAVRLVYQRVYAKLAEGPFRSLDDLNAHIRSLVDVHNRTPYQGREESRYDRFISEDRPQLSSLPSDRFELRRQARVKVQKNSHVHLSIDRHYYSVPHSYIGKRVKLVWTRRTVEIYSDRTRIAFHRRTPGRFGYTSTPSHLPSNHQAYLSWSPTGTRINKESIPPR